MRILPMLGAFLFFASTVFSQNIFIKYDDSCMDRYEYQLGANSSGKGFITYHVKLDNGAKVILEVGPESIRNRKRLPKGVKTCKTAGFGQTMVDRINSKQLKVYIVRKDGNRYNYSPVGLAAYSTESVNEIVFRAKNYNFNYKIKESNPGQDLSNTASNSEVYLEGTSPYVCSNSYLFRKIPRLVCYAYTDIVYVPNIGIVEERTGRTVEEAEKNKLKLVSINNQPFEQYYANVVCPQPKPTEPAIVAAPTPAQPAFVPTEFSDKTPTISYGWIARNQPETLTERAPQTNAILLDKIGERRVEFVQADPEYGLIALAEEEEPVVYEFTEKTVPVPAAQPCSVASAPGVHIVQREETLYGISRQYGASVDQLRVWNKLGNADMIHPCMQLYTIPPSTFNPTVITAPAEPQGDCVETSFPGVHIVQKGETLYAIGRQYGLSISDLRKWNDLNNVNELSPCMRIATAQPEQVLPVTNPAPNTASQPATTTPAQPSTPTFDGLVEKGIEVPGVIVVKRGETLYQIAKDNGLNVNQLRNWNKLPSDVLTPGQLLYTAPLDNTPQPYNNTIALVEGVNPNVVIVKPGETLSQIARNNNLTIDNLRDWNRLKNDILKPGQILYIIAPTAPTSYDNSVALRTDNNIKTPCLESSRPGIHVVQPGETLYEISKIHGLTVQQLQGWNRLQAGDILHPCAKLVTVAPQSTTPKSYDASTSRIAATTKCNKKSSAGVHIVQTGETLYQLSKRYKVKVEQLQTWNGLGNSTYLAPCTSLNVKKPANYAAAQPRINTKPTPAPAQAPAPVPLLKEKEPVVITKIICEQSSKPGLHIVQQGETLSQIARTHKVTAAQLRAWNNLGNSDLISACMALNTRPTTTPTTPVEYNVVVVPTPQPKPVQEQLVPKTVTTRRIIHVVKLGETLGSIANRYNITVPELLGFNQLPNNTIIFVGQQLYASPEQEVPQVTAPATSNTAANALIPAGIQRETPVSFDAPAQQRIAPSNNNNIPATAPAQPAVTTQRPPNSIVPADVFTSRSPEPATFETTVSVTGQKQVHIVRDGETLESIAKMYGLSASRLRSINLLAEGDVVIPLQKIYISK